MDRKNEVAGLVAIGGFVSLVLALAGVAGLLEAILTNESVFVVAIDSDGGRVGSQAIQGGGGSVLWGAVLAAAGAAGLAATWGAVTSGYFDESAGTSETPSRETASGETPETAPEADRETA